MVNSKHPLVYFAHPYGGSRAALNTAEIVFCTLQAICPGVTLFAPWLTLCRRWPETPENREIGIGLCLKAVEASDGVLAVYYDHQQSHGVDQEIKHAETCKLATLRFFLEGFGGIEGAYWRIYDYLEILKASPVRASALKRFVEGAPYGKNESRGICLPFNS